MKRIIISLTVLAFLFSFNSCKQACERNKTGEVKVTNNTDVELWFDVAMIGDEYENENRKLSPGASTVYVMDEGGVNVWVSETNVTADFEKVEIMNVVQCETVTYSLEECIWYKEGTLTVKNTTGSTIDIRIWQKDSNGSYYSNDAWISDLVRLQNNESVTWEMVRANMLLDIGMVYVGVNGSWVLDTYTLESCEHYTYIWSGTKNHSIMPEGLSKGIDVESNTPKRQRVIDPSRVKRGNL